MQPFSENQPQQCTFCNPILPGFYPDPSVCRVGDDYYLVNSSFAYFPGIPIFHSRDLVHWEQLGHVLDRQSQLDLEGAGESEGIFAPTIRYHQGTFYVITTNISQGGNFIVTATNPAGPWSEPFWLPDAPGIDPSLFFDDAGRAYYVGTRPAPEGERYFGNWEIWLQELDLVGMRLQGEAVPLWRGALREVIWPEGPHLYQKDGWFYLMIAEGGTDYHHAVTIARSQSLTGPYEGNPANPILTHRHLGRSFPIVNVGHGDLVETLTGEWWMVVLASRPAGGYYRNLGRETFLVPVIWEDGWPVVSPGSGRIEPEYPVPALPQFTVTPPSVRDDFTREQLDLCWNCYGNSGSPFWSLTERPGYLRLQLRTEPINGLQRISFIGRRQQHHHFTAGTVLEFVPDNPDAAAGIILYQNSQYHYRFEVALHEQQQIVRLIQCANGKEAVLAVKPIAGSRIHLKVIARGQDYSFYYGVAEGEAEPLFEGADGRILSTDLAGGFIGTYIGLFVSGNGSLSRNRADFDWFEYQGDISR